jgi:hypothetical protein
VRSRASLALLACAIGIMAERSALAAECGTNTPWIVYPAIAAGAAIVGGVGSSSLIELLNEDRAFPYLPSSLLSSGATMGLVATYAGLTPECTLANGENGWKVGVPIASFLVSATIPLVIWYLSPIRRKHEPPPDEGFAVLPTRNGATAVWSIRF